MEDQTARDMIEAIDELRKTVKGARRTLFWMTLWIFLSMLNSCEIKNRLIEIATPATKPAEPTQK